MPRFSIVIPTRNGAKTLGQAVHSVLGQTFEDFELIIVDDGSTDDTGTLLESLVDSRVRSLRQRAGGVSRARNAGVREAEGDFVTFLDDDDAASPRWLENFTSLMDVPDRLLVRCAMLRVGSDDLIREVVFPGHPDNFEQWVNRFLAGTFAIRRKLFEDVGGYDEALHFGENTELSMRLWAHRLQHGWSVGMSARTMVRARLGGSYGRYGAGSPQMAEYALNRHRGLFAAHPDTRATYLAIVGVHAAKAGDLRKARRYLWRSWIALPWRPKSLARLMASTMAPVRRRLWTRPVPRPVGRHERDIRSTEGRKALAGIEDGNLVSVRHSPRGRPKMVSVVIPTAGDTLTLSQQLEALARQTYEADWEVVVSDNSGRPDTAAVLTQWTPQFHSLRHVDSSDRAGAGHARNVGVREARGDFLAFCDDDDLVSPGWLAEMVAEAKHSDTVGGRLEITRLNPKEVLAGRLVATDSLSSSRGPFLPFAASANCGAWRDVHWWIGGWRESYGSSGEDVDYSWRSQLSFFELRFAADAVVHYRLRSRYGALARQLWSYGLIWPRLFRDYREAGMDRRSPGLALKQWAWVFLHLPDLLRGAERRRSWIRVSARAAALVYGSFRFRVAYW